MTEGEDEQEAWERLGAFISAHRKALNLRQRDVETAGGPSAATQRHIEHGTGGRSKRALRDLATAYGWTVSSIDRIKQGQTPVSSRESSPEATTDLPAQEEDEEEETDLMMVRVPRSLSARSRAQLVQAVEEYARNMVKRPGFKNGGSLAGPSPS